jgi:hypothetical protein
MGANLHASPHGAKLEKTMNPDGRNALFALASFMAFGLVLGIFLR